MIGPEQRPCGCHPDPQNQDTSLQHQRKHHHRGVCPLRLTCFGTLGTNDPIVHKLLSPWTPETCTVYRDDPLHVSWEHVIQVVILDGEHS